MTIAIIGAGASGMMAALAAARTGASVLLLERQARVGRKLLATGNGRCNLSNIHADVTNYHGEDPAFVRPSLTVFSQTDTITFFERLGLYTVTEDSGKVYPYSDQANSVVDVLRFALEQSNIQLITGAEVSKVKMAEGKFQITATERFEADKLIVACGGAAGSKLGGTLSGYQILRSFGHKCTRLRPSLVQLKSSYPRCPALKGIRAQAALTITKDREPFAQSQGEVQFTDYGISGPTVFEISRDVAAAKGNWEAVLDLLPGMEWDVFTTLLKQRLQTDRCAEDLLTGILHNRLGKILIQEAGISLNTPCRDLSETELRRVFETVRGFRLTITESIGLDGAQVTAGGILTKEFDPATLESRKVSGLYACGEVLDIDGDCGGFNLQWAWSSGYVAGTSAGKAAL